MPLQRGDEMQKEKNSLPIPSICSTSFFMTKNRNDCHYDSLPCILAKYLYITTKTEKETTRALKKWKRE